MVHVETAYLDSSFRQTEALRELLPHEGVRVVRLVKQSLKLVQLLQGEVCPGASLLHLAKTRLVRATQRKDWV